MPDKFFIIFVCVLTFLINKQIAFVDGSSNSTLKYKHFSYTVYETGWSLSNDGSLEVWFRTGQKDAMLLYQDDEGEGFVDVFLVGGKIRMRIKTDECDLEERIVNGSFNDFKWHKLVIRKEGENITLIIDDIAAPPVKCSPEEGRMTALYTGYISIRFIGNPTQGWAFPRSMWESVKSTFQGCITDIQYTVNGVVTRPRLRVTSGTEHGCSSACKSLKCRHGGQCVDRILTAWCDCEGTGYHGKHCARVNRKTSTNSPTTSTPPPTAKTIISREKYADSATPSPKERKGSKAKSKNTGVYHGVHLSTVTIFSVLAMAMASCT